MLYSYYKRISAEYAEEIKVIYGILIFMQSAGLLLIVSRCFDAYHCGLRAREAA